MNITTKDVAKHAGVSVATVSYVINKGPRPVAEETRLRVQQSIDELGYKPNLLARGLNTGRTHTIGVIIADISDPFYPPVILGAESVARQRGYSVFLCNGNRDPELENHYINLLTERRTDGLMIVGSRLNEAMLKKTADIQNAVILTSLSVPDAMVFSLDDHNGGYQIGKHLIALGHKKIRYLEGNWIGSTGHRYQGLKAALEESGIDTKELMVSAVSQISIDNGRMAAHEFLKKNPDITALVCYNDILALGVLEACLELGIKVPDDLSVVGFDNIRETERSSPPLTTIEIDKEAIGVDMMKRLIDSIDSKEKNFERVMVPVQLIERMSSAPLKT